MIFFGQRGAPTLDNCMKNAFCSGHPIEPPFFLKMIYSPLTALVRYILAYMPSLGGINQRGPHRP